MASSQKGATLVELLIAVAFLSTVTLATALAYIKTMQALVASQNQGIASRLAEDELETLEGLPYTNLMVTTQSDLNNPPKVDQTYYPPETFNMGGESFTRSVIVSKVYKDSSGNITVLSPAAADTGLKQINALVSYPLSQTMKTLSLTALVSNPNLVPLNATVYGVVTDTSGAAIAGAKIFVTQNQNWTAIASSSGSYQLQMDTATYTITATQKGYWDGVSSPITCLSSCQQNFQLETKLTGSVTGYITVRPTSLMISGVFGGQTSPPTGDFLELFNPTTYPILIGNGTPQIKIVQISSNNTVSNVTLTLPGTGSIDINPQQYYLIATDSPTVNGVIPDALFGFPAVPFQNDQTGGVAVQNSFGVGMDTVGWSFSGCGPSNGVETCGVGTSLSNWNSGGSLFRKSNPSGVNAGQGSSYTTNDNAFDVLMLSAVPLGYPRNSFSLQTPVQYGIAAASAAVSATDGYSASTVTTGAGAYRLPNVTTGTWSVVTFWNSYSSVTADDVQVYQGSATDVDILLESSSGNEGGISGMVVRSDTLAPLAAINISASIGNTLTGGGGNYILTLPSGTYSISANEGFPNIDYNTIQTTAAVVSGQITGNVNFNLIPSGIVTGQVTTNGTDAYPNFPVHALSQGLEVATAVTDSLGNYSLYGVPVAADVIEPILSGAETSSPQSISLTMTQGATSSGNNFIVNGSLGKITGLATQGGLPIATGVLVVASTATFTQLPIISSQTISNSLIFTAVSDPAGKYSINVVQNSSYTLYAYFTSISGNTTVTMGKTITPVYVSGSQVQNLSW
ncbi:MAG: carboxypeptidase regulatory-like domain-containing protein [Elusimicrobiota bacterium]